MSDVGRPGLYDIPGVMSYLNSSRTSVFGLIKEGTLKSVKVGRRRLVPREALDDYINALQKAQGSARDLRVESSITAGTD